MTRLLADGVDGYILGVYGHSFPSTTAELGAFISELSEQASGKGVVGIVSA